MARQKPITSPIGTFKWPKLVDPDYGTKDYPKEDGEYSVKLVLQAGTPEADQLITKLQPIYDDAMDRARAAFSNLPVATRKKLKSLTENPLYTEIYDEETEQPTGEIEFKFSMKAGGVNKKTKKPWSRKPAIFDAKGQRMHPAPAIWGGTTGRVSFEIGQDRDDNLGYFIPGTGVAGLSFKLIGAQIINLVSAGGRSADDLGFDEQEGYEYDPSDADTGKDTSAVTSSDVDDDEDDENVNF